MAGRSRRTVSSALNHYPLWRYILIVALIVFAVIYALPNVFGESPAIQVSPKGGKAITPALVQKVKDSLSAANVNYNKFIVGKYQTEMRFANTTDQLAAQDALQAGLGKKYVVALNLAPNTPKWLLDLGAYPMKLGLDLRGGMYFLMDVDMQTVLKNQLDNTASSLRTELRQQDIRYSNIVVKNAKTIQVSFRQAKAIDAAKVYIIQHYPMMVSAVSDDNPLQLDLSLSQEESRQIQSYAVQQTVQVMRNRVNELGVAEATVQRQGLDRVVIELPGVQDAARAKEILGGTSTLKVQLVNEKADVAAALRGAVPIGSGVYYNEHDQPYVLYNRVIITGKTVVGASTGFDSNTGLPTVNVRLSGPQVSEFSEVTGQNVGHLMAIVLVTTTFNKHKINGKVVTQTQVHNKIISVASIQSRLGNNFQINGIGGMREAQNLALMIRAGSLPAPVQIVEERQIGPSLGAANIRMGATSVTVAMIAVIIFMAIYYGLMGVIADIALILNLFFIIAIMSILPGATLTLPGIAGIVLNVGMAIDANVLIFERIREEIRNGTTIQAAIHAGYQRAFSTIVDSNVTTLIVAIILFAIGSGSVKGFAVTLIIGILSSMFTAITVTRAIVNLIYGRRDAKRISIGI